MISRRKMLNWSGLGFLAGCPFSLSKPRHEEQPPVLRIETRPSDTYDFKARDARGREVLWLSAARVEFNSDGPDYVTLDLHQLMVEPEFFDFSGLQRQKKVCWSCNVIDGKPVCQDELGNVIEGAEVVGWSGHASSPITWQVRCTCEVDWLPEKRFG